MMFHCCMPSPCLPMAVFQGLLGSYLELERHFPIRVGAEVQTTKAHLICVYLKNKMKSHINANEICNWVI